jgi:hypothetical protein
MKKSASWFLSLAIVSLTAFASESDQLPNNDLATKHPIHAQHLTNSSGFCAQ